MVADDWSEDEWHHAVDGAGFGVLDRDGRTWRLERRRTLPDAISTDLRVLCVGLNPSLTAADLGHGFASPSNRFWPAALDAGLVKTPKAPWTSIEHDRVGFTDLVKRATRAASELRAAEFREGRRRLEWTTGLHEPRVVCVMGITGWRRIATGEVAGNGWQDEQLGGRPVYVMPNPSGLNAHTSRADLAAHLTEVLRAAD